MEISIKEVKADKKVPFSFIGVGDYFKFENKLCVKTVPFKQEGKRFIFNTYNAANGEACYVSDSLNVIKIESVSIEVGL